MHLAGGIKSLSLTAALIGVIALLHAAPSAAQTPPPDPPLANSSNVHLLGHIPGSAAGMNFKDHYAFVSGWGGVTVLDIAKGRPARAGRGPPPSPLRERGHRPVRQRAARRERP
jgi:hypothetical protein